MNPGVDDLHATVLGPAAIVAAGGHRPLFTVGHDAELATGRTRGVEIIGDGIASALAQAQIVLAGTALISVTLQGDPGVSVGTHIGCVCAQNLAILTPEVRLVEIKVDHPLG